MSTITSVPLKEPLKQFQVDNCKQWVAALRSGEYKQTAKSLMSLDMQSFCCLGVACDIKGMEKDVSGNSAWFIYGGSHQDTLPHKDYFKFVYGFDASRVIARDNISGNVELASLNDNVGLTFSQIADVIEASCIDRVSKEFNYVR